MRLSWAGLLVVAVLLVSGCGDDDDDGAVTTTTEAPSSTTTTEAPTTTTTEPTTTTTAVASPIVLEPDGIGVAHFGDDRDITVSMVSAVLGPVDETGPGCELAGPDATVVRWDDLQVQFVNDAFNAYSVRPFGGAAVLDLRTAAGIGLGSTVADLRAAYGPDVTIPGLPADVFGGNDFAISFDGDLRILGSLSDTSDSGTVTSFFTQTCE